MEMVNLPTVKNIEELIVLIDETLKKQFERKEIRVERSNDLLIIGREIDEEIKYFISDVLENEFSIQLQDCEIKINKELDEVNMKIKLPDYINHYFKTGRW